MNINNNYVYNNSKDNKIIILSLEEDFPVNNDEIPNDSTVKSSKITTNNSNVEGNINNTKNYFDQSKSNNS